MAIVDVVNIALRDVGEQAITTAQLTDDSTVRGTIVNDIYQEIRDKELRLHAWNFAIRRGGLAGFSHPEPDHEFDRAYLLPTGAGNYNKALRVVDIGGNFGQIRYKMEKKHILSNENGTMVNLLSDQDDFTSSNWTETGTGSTTANAVTGPDFALNADTITDSDAAAAFVVSQGVSAGDGIFYFAGVKIKKNTSLFATLQIKLTGGTTPITAFNEIKFSDNSLIRGGAQAGQIHSYDRELLDNSYKWLWLSVENNTTGNTTATFELYPTGLASEAVSNTGSLYAVDAWTEAVSPLDGRWVEQMIDPDDWTDDFKTFYAASLARSLAVPLTNSATLYQRFDTRRKEELRAARSADAVEDFPEQFPESSWTSVRRGSPNSARGWIS